MNDPWLQYNWIKGLDITQCRDYKSHPHLLSRRTAPEVTGHFSTEFVEFKNPFLHNSRVTVRAANDKSTLQPHIQVTEMILSLLADDGLEHPSPLFSVTVWGTELLHKAEMQQPSICYLRAEARAQLQEIIFRCKSWLDRISFLRCVRYFWRGIPFQYSLLALLHTWLWIQFWVRHLKMDYYSNRHYNSKIFWEKFIPTLHFVFLNWQHISEWALVKPCIFRKNCGNYWVIFYCLSYAESHI